MHLWQVHTQKYAGEMFLDGKIYFSTFVFVMYVIMNFAPFSNKNNE